jgi:hypothetical protein
VLVVLVEDNLPPLQWRLGRVVEVHPGADNIVRVLSIKTISGVVKRAIKKVCVSPNSNRTSGSLFFSLVFCFIFYFIV